MVFFYFSCQAVYIKPLTVGGKIISNLPVPIKSVVSESLDAETSFAWRNGDHCVRFVVLLHQAYLPYWSHWTFAETRFAN